MSNRLWISWEDHRRSAELAKEFRANYIPITFTSNRYLRYPIHSMMTLIFLIRIRPKLLFCQNPSIVLATFLVLMRPIFRFRLIVDRHSNFKLETKDLSSFKWRVFHILSRYTVRKADLTIVTNTKLSLLCEKMGGRAVVLQDKIPELNVNNKRAQPSFLRDFEKPQIMFVTMFDPDEPIKEIIDASKNMPDCIFYLTGNYKKVFPYGLPEKGLESNVVLTGFVSDEDYLSLMKRSDLVVVLTKKDLILNCGAYEAISFNKPLVLSDTETLRSYFRKAAAYTKNGSFDIENNLRHCLNVLDKMQADLIEEKRILIENWSDKFSCVNKIICDLERH